MDLKKYDLAPSAERGAQMIVRDPITDEDMVDENGLPVSITLLGNDSREFRRKVDQIARARQRRKGEVGLAESERQGAELLAAVTKDWRGIQWDGEDLPCTFENAAMLYRELGWLRRQVDEFVGDAGNFFKRPETT